MDLLETPHLLTAEEYATIDTEARTELLGGFIYDVAPRNDPHRHASRELNRLLARGIADDQRVQIADSVAIPDWKGRDAPEVDVAVLKSRGPFVTGPTSADALVLIEIAHATYRLDRGYKIPLYVRAGVPAFIVNVEKRQVEYYGSEADLDATHGQGASEGEAVAILGIDIPVTSLFE